MMIQVKMKQKWRIDIGLKKKHNITRSLASYNNLPNKENKIEGAEQVNTHNLIKLGMQDTCTQTTQQSAQEIKQIEYAEQVNAHKPVEQEMQDT